MERVDVLILGGGLAGLSTAYHLQKAGRSDFLVVEKKGRVGGLAGSERRGGFTFDYTGHLLHLHTPYGKRLVTNLLRGNLVVRDRSSWIFSHDRYTRYPFQANTYGLPEKVVRECVAGFLANLRGGASPPDQDASFEDWARATFGEGICRHFMFPYNRKLWRADLAAMTTEWQGRFIPRPKPEEVLYGALTDQKKFFGYNATFRYPLRGGIQSLPDALARRLANVRLNAAVTRVDLEAKVAVIDGVGEVAYRRLVNTLPLKHFIGLASEVPAEVRKAAGKLRYRTVYNLNLGVARPRISDKQWIYFPEDKFVFYRAGVSTNFSPHLAPRGASSLYIEVSRLPEEAFDFNAVERKILDGLRACGLLKPADRLLERAWMPIPCGYVLYDRDRAPAVGTLFAHLKSKDVESIGRYGAWKYSFMEEAIMDGKACAERLMGLGPAPVREKTSASGELAPIK